MSDKTRDSVNAPQQDSNEQQAQFAALRVLELATSFLAFQATHVAARLALADHIWNGHTTKSQLAQITQCDPDTLERLLLTLIELGLLRYDESTGDFELTDAGHILREDSPFSLKNYVLCQGVASYPAAAHLEESIRTGEPAAPGIDIFSQLRENPSLLAIFTRAMTDFVHAFKMPTVGAFDFSNANTVVDLGGGSGVLLQAILEKNSHLRGVLFELPEVAELATAKLADAEILKRCDIVSGDIFTDPLPAGDVYVLSAVLHCFGDEEAAKLLTQVRESLPATGHLLILEAVRPSASSLRVARLLDLHMLSIAGGRERTEEQFAALLSQAGLSISDIYPGDSSPISLLVAKPTASV
ncbi:methyltransferase [Streptomyces sp. LBL]|uniref:methyltransferase n=1 Tax=Streptomyces sp. LBL TaxID=2940562 RepID=UPI0024756754|nr:methyltransferase [Streptomyces sp. LBL]